MSTRNLKIINIHRNLRTQQMSVFVLVHFLHYMFRSLLVAMLRWLKIMFLGSRARPARVADNLITTWDPHHLTTLYSTACYEDSFTFLYRSAFSRLIKTNEPLYRFQSCMYRWQQ
jgi:hypothetical protein